MLSVPPGSPADGPDDERLLAAVRAGDDAAFQELYGHYSESAHRLAAALVGPDAADDLVSEAFARALAQLRRGAGPTGNFRSYLHSTIRNRHRDLLRTDREDAASDQPWLLDEREPSAEELAAGIDDNGAVTALTSLPDSWQRALWYVEVEGRKPAEVATLLGTNAVAVSSLVYRAREGLRRSYLDQVVSHLPLDRGCGWARQRLSQHVREDLSGRATQKLEKHLAACDSCSLALAEMEEVNQRLAALLFPVVLAGGLAQLGAGGNAAAPVAAAGIRPGAKPSRLAKELTARAAGQAPAQAAAAAATATLSAGVLAAVAVAGVAAAAAVAATAFSLANAQPDGDANPDARPSNASGTHDQTDATASEEPTHGATEHATAPSSDVEPVVPPTTSTSGATTEPPTPTDAATPPPDDPPTPTQSPTEPPTQPPAPVEARPEHPVAVPITACGTYGSLTLPTTEGVRYELTRGDGREGPWTVRANARTGYVIADGAPQRFTGDLGRFTSCPVEVRPQAPTAVPITTCGTYGSLTLPTTEGIRYELTRGDGREGPWTVRATARNGYVIADGAPQRFTGDLGRFTSCPVEVRPQAPTAVPITTCGTYGSLTLPTTEGIRYELTRGDGREGPWEVTATPTDGYVIPADAQHIFSGDVGSFEPCPVEVRPEAPVAVPITACGTYGSLALPTTEGIRYELSTGDGREGAWEVTAAPTDGYVIPADAQRSFSGDLGAHYPCPSVSVAPIPLGDPVADPWRIQVDAVVGGPRNRAVEVDYIFDYRVLISAKSGAGWACTGPAGEIGSTGSPFIYLAGTEFTCRFEYAGTAPPPVALDVQTIDDSSVIVDPRGTVLMRVDGTHAGFATFAP